MKKAALVVSYLVAIFMFCCNSIVLAEPHPQGEVGIYILTHIIIFPVLLIGLWIYLFRLLVRERLEFLLILTCYDLLIIILLFRGLGFYGIWEPLIERDDVYHVLRVFILFSLFLGFLFTANKWCASLEKESRWIIKIFLMIVSCFLFIAFPQPFLTGPVAKWCVDREKLDKTDYILKYYWAKEDYKSIQTGDDVKHTIVGKMILIKPQGFTMGSPSTEKGRHHDEIQHDVILTKGFYIQDAEITEEQWIWVMTECYNTLPSDFPISIVSWNAANKFIQRLNFLEKTNKYRLPTEAEWEYACCAGKSDNLVVNGGRSLKRTVKEYGKRLNNRPDDEPAKHLRKVQSVPGNAWNIHGMHGNVQEWVQDWYGEYPEGEVVDPKGPATGTKHVARGGSYGSPAEDCRCAARKAYPPDYKANNLGFRVVRDL